MTDTTTAHAYYCRNCTCTTFLVCWYDAPVAESGESLSPGWTIECSFCHRVTLLPGQPDLSEEIKQR